MRTHSTIHDRSIVVHPAPIEATLDSFCINAGTYIESCVLSGAPGKVNDLRAKNQFWPNQAMPIISPANLNALLSSDLHQLGLTWRMKPLKDSAKKVFCHCADVTDLGKPIRAIRLNDAPVSMVECTKIPQHEPCDCALNAVEQAMPERPETGKDRGYFQAPYRCQTCIDQDVWNIQAMQNKRIVPESGIQKYKVICVRSYPSKRLAEILYLLIRFSLASHDLAPPIS